MILIVIVKKGNFLIYSFDWFFELWLLVNKVSKIYEKIFNWNNFVLKVKLVVYFWCKMMVLFIVLVNFDIFWVIYLKFVDCDGCVNK